MEIFLSIPPPTTLNQRFIEPLFQQSKGVALFNNIMLKLVVIGMIYSINCLETIGLSGVRALPLAAGINEGGH